MIEKVDLSTGRSILQCYGCGKVCRTKLGLYAHLRACYWFKHFENNIENAPFYQERPSKQLRYYWRNRKKINAARAGASSKKKKFVPKSMRR